MLDNTRESDRTPDPQMELVFVADQMVRERKSLFLHTKTKPHPWRENSVWLPAIWITSERHTWLNVVQCAQFRSSISSYVMSEDLTRGEESTLSPTESKDISGINWIHLLRILKILTYLANATAHTCHSKESTPWSLSQNQTHTNVHITQRMLSQ